MSASIAYCQFDCMRSYALAPITNQGRPKLAIFCQKFVQSRQLKSGEEKNRSIISALMPSQVLPPPGSWRITCPPLGVGLWANRGAPAPCPYGHAERLVVALNYSFAIASFVAAAVPQAGASSPSPHLRGR